MKRYLQAVLTGTVIFTLISCAGSYTVTTQPTPPSHVRPLSPGSDYMWLDGEWAYQHGQYTWHEGHWRKQRNNRNWQPGHWEQRKNGWYWKRGHWY